ncbi:MAG: R3H domain-containing nucleic acid-binding protein, partial [Bryocella sp.]
YKAERAADLKEIAEEGIDHVEDTNEPFRFPPMTSRERRMLHMFLKDSGLKTASSGEGPRRFVVLYPEGFEIPVEQPRFGRRDSRGRGNSRGGDRGRSNSGGRY